MSFFTQLPLPFDYLTYVATYNTVSHIRDYTTKHNLPFLEKEAFEVVKESVNRLCPDNVVLAKDIMYTMAFCEDNLYTYRVRSSVDLQIQAVLDSPFYFPENINDYINELGRESDACYHNALSRMWRLHGAHLAGRDGIFGLARLYGTINNKPVMRSSEYPCLYHRGMNLDNVDPIIKMIVTIYDTLEETLGFPPVYVPYGEVVIPGEDFLVTSNPKNEITSISISTLVGRIWLKGSPKEGELGGVTIKQVKDTDDDV